MRFKDFECGCAHAELIFTLFEINEEYDMAIRDIMPGHKSLADFAIDTNSSVGDVADFCVGKRPLDKKVIFKAISIYRPSLKQARALLAANKKIQNNPCCVDKKRFGA